MHRPNLRFYLGFINHHSNKINIVKNQGKSKEVPIRQKHKGAFMKYLVLSILAMSCANHAIKSYQQVCSSKGMVLSGVTSSSGGGMSYGSNNVAVGSSYSGESIQCLAPTSDYQRCEVDRINKTITPLKDYNAYIGSKRMATGLGYVAFVLPGIGAKMFFDGQLNDAYDASKKIDQETKSECMDRKSASEN